LQTRSEGRCGGLQAKNPTDLVFALASTAVLFVGDGPAFIKGVAAASEGLALAVPAPFLRMHAGCFHAPQTVPTFLS